MRIVYEKIFVQKRNNSLVLLTDISFTFQVKLMIEPNFITKKRNWKVKNENKKQIQCNKMYSNYRMFALRELEL
ncbi:hypothetical protein BWD13_07805 [Leptospira santarosai serovar Grippotyphosa]|nr:hypothetical protein BWD13_07805 [Leptospira santarosai serovar Grippotyphosa]